MVRYLISTVIIMTALTAVFFVTGCETQAQTDALIGTGIGAGAGQLIGGDTKATLIGGAIGGGAGYVVGSQADKKDAKAAASVQAAQQEVTVWIVNSNGSKSPVKLTRSGPGFIGPKGEYYETLPTAEVLKPVYGF